MEDHIGCEVGFQRSIIAYVVCRKYMGLLEMPWLHFKELVEVDKFRYPIKFLYY